MTWATDVFDPIRDALKVLCGGKEPPDYVKGHDFKGLTEDQTEKLQDWVNMNLSDTIFWSTGIGALDAAELLVEEALANDNILRRELAAEAKEVWLAKQKRKRERAAKRKKKT